MTFDPDVFGSDRVYPDGSFMFQCHLFGYRDLASRLQPGVRVLDLACGDGYGSAVVAARGCETVGLDLDGALLAQSAGKYRAARFVAASALRLPFAESTFDAVGALQVIEHLVETQELLREIARVLRPGGLLYVTTPNIAQLPATASKEFNPHHLRDFTPGELETELRAVFGEVQLYGQMLDESLPRARSLLTAAEAEWRVIDRVAAVERLVRGLPGPVRVRLRKVLLRLSGVPRWPLPEAEAARGAITAEDFRTAAPAEASGNTIAVARKS
ncbi:MAG: methyltransferase domain-containing protein [Actinomycetota bacterium]